MHFLSQYKGLRRENYVLAFGRLVTGLGSMAWPMMTLILSQKMGIGAKEISWILAAAMIVMAPAVYFGGRIADRFNKKKVIVWIDLLSVACYAACALLPLSWLTIFLMFIGSTGQNMENPAYGALIADITVTADRDKAYSLQYLCANLGLVLSPTIAGLLFTHYLWLVFLINGISILCSALLIQTMVRDISPAEDTSVRAVYQTSRQGVSVMSVLKESRVIMLFIAAVSGYYATYHMYVYLMPLDLAAWHGDSGALIFGSVTSVNCIVVVVFTPVITRLFGDRPETDRTIAGMVLLVAGFGMFLLFAKHIPAYYIAMTILTIGEIFAMTSESAYLSRRVPASHRGRVNGVYTVFRTLLTSAYQLLIGAVYAGFGSTTAWMLVLLLGVLFILLAVFMRREDRITYPNLYSE